MALYVCPKCPWKERYHKYHRAEAGETTFRFANGNLWVFPNLILHFINDHSWLPPQEFIDDAMCGTQVFFSRIGQETTCRRIAYLEEADLVSGDVPDGLVERLEALIQETVQQEKVLKYYGPGEK